MKKVVKIIGSVMTVVAIILVAIRVYNYNVDFSLMFTSRTLLPCVIYLLLQTALIMLPALPWRAFLEYISDKPIPLSNAIKIFGESSIYKYIPGNVFQYVGRNKLAFDLDISHFDVAAATIMDILCNLFGAAVVSLVLLNKDIISLMSLFNIDLMVAAIIILAAVVIALIMFSAKVKGHIKTILSKVYRGNIKQFLKYTAFYIAYVILNHVVLLLSYYFLITSLISETLPLGTITQILGAYVVAWLIGFITPGSPGGIGIREAAMILVCPANIDSDILILFVLTLRVLSVFSDVLALIISRLIKADNLIKDE